MKHLLIVIQTLVAAVALACAAKDDSTSATQQQKHEQKIRGEASGYFHPIDNPESLIISTDQQQPDEAELHVTVPLELKAYNALMEQGVLARDGTMRSGFYTNDASIFPFADTTVTGMDKIKPYLIAYSNRGVVHIDSVMNCTYEFEYGDRYVLEYAMFKVRWTRSNF